MAAGEPWWAAKYSHGVWEHFPDQENPFLKNHFFVNFGTPPATAAAATAAAEHTQPDQPPANMRRDQISRKGIPPHSSSKPPWGDGSVGDLARNIFP